MVIESKFNIAETAINQITYLVEQKRLTYIDAITEYAYRSGLEIETVAEIIQKNAYIKAEIEKEAETLKYLKKQDRLDFN